MPADELLHFGVKGMRWGVRKEQHFQETASADAKAAKASQAVVKKVGTQALSNADFEAMLKRMDLEKRYKEHTLNKRPTSEGEKWAEQQLKQLGGTALQSVMKKYALKYGADLMKHLIGW